MRAVPALDLHGAATPDDWDLVSAALDDYPLLAIHDTGTEDAPEWRVFFRETVDRDRAAATLAAQFPALTITPVLVDDEDWAGRSQAALRAISVGRLIVAPPWDLPERGTIERTPGGRDFDPAVIVIQPSTGFGTGHHETTRLCLSLLQEQDVLRRHVLDVGTGSGVLAIAAVALGAARVTAIDVDPDALDNARENARLNGIALEPHGSDDPVLTIASADIRQLETTADIVLANLTGALLTASGARLRALVRRGGVLIASGFLHHEVDTVIPALERAGFDLVTHRREGEWNGAALRRR